MSKPVYVLQSRCPHCGEVLPKPDTTPQDWSGEEVREGEEEFDRLKNLVKLPPRPPQNADTEVAQVLEDLLTWAKYMGGFENRVWKQATNLHEKLTGRRIDV